MDIITRRTGDTWTLETSPDLLRRLKRIFPRVHAASKKSIDIKHTREVARDLVMCATRWNLVMSDEDWSYLRSEGEAYDHTQAEVARLSAGGTLEPLTDRDYAVELRPHQISARDTALTTRGLLVGDELGAGKTFSGLSVLAVAENRPAIAVTIGGAIPAQWKREAERLYPGIRVHILKQNAEYDLSQVCDGHAPELLICTYSKLAAWGPRLAGQARTVIFDEVQELRRSDSNKYHGACVLADAAGLRIGLSATPIWNRLDEAYNIVRVLNPEVLGGRNEFLREWSDGTYMHTSQAEGLRAHLTNSGVYLRRTDVVGLDTPVVEEVPVPYDTETMADAETTAAAIAKLILTGSHKDSYTARGQLDMWMRQATGVAKARHVAAFVSTLLETRDKVVLFGFHRDVYALWAEVFDSLGVRHAMYTGSESERQKRKSVSGFVDGDTQVLMMSLRSSAALDGLQAACHTLVFGELDWAPGVHAQGLGRLRRPGQTNRVEAYWCVTDSGSDPIIMDVHASKLAETEAFIKDDAELSRVSSVRDADGLEALARAILERQDPGALENLPEKPDIAELLG